MTGAAKQGPRKMFDNTFAPSGRGRLISPKINARICKRNWAFFLMLISGVLMGLTLLLSCHTTGSKIPQRTDHTRSLPGTPPVKPNGSPPGTDIRLFLFAVDANWRRITAAWPRKGDPSGRWEEKEHEIARLETEFSKFFDNAVLLYLKGVWTEDLLKSMYTLETIIRNAESYCSSQYPEASQKLPMVPADNDGFATQAATRDPEREFLFNVKSFWDEMNTRLKSRRIVSGLAVEKVSALNDLHGRFSQLYPGALTAFLEGGSGSMDLDAYFQPLREITEEAKEIYP